VTYPSLCEEALDNKEYSFVLGLTCKVQSYNKRHTMASSKKIQLYSLATPNGMKVQCTDSLKGFKGLGLMNFLECNVLQSMSSQSHDPEIFCN
jgi:hypothetical protein